MKNTLLLIVALSLPSFAYAMEETKLPEDDGGVSRAGPTEVGERPPSAAPPSRHKVIDPHTLLWEGIREQQPVLRRIFSRVWGIDIDVQAPSLQQQEALCRLLDEYLARHHGNCRELPGFILRPQINDYWAKQGYLPALERQFKGYREKQYGYPEDLQKAEEIKGLIDSLTGHDKNEDMIDGLLSGTKGYPKDPAQALKLIEELIKQGNGNIFLKKLGMAKKTRWWECAGQRRPAYQIADTQQQVTHDGVRVGNPTAILRMIFGLEKGWDDFQQNLGEARQFIDEWARKEVRVALFFKFKGHLEGRFDYPIDHAQARELYKKLIAVNDSWGDDALNTEIQWDDPQTAPQLSDEQMERVNARRIEREMAGFANGMYGYLPDKKEGRVRNEARIRAGNFFSLKMKWDGFLNDNSSLYRHHLYYQHHYYWPRPFKEHMNHLVRMYADYDEGRVSTQDIGPRLTKLAAYYQRGLLKDDIYELIVSFKMPRQDISPSQEKKTVTGEKIAPAAAAEAWTTKPPPANEPAEDSDAAGEVDPSASPVSEPTQDTAAAGEVKLLPLPVKDPQILSHLITMKEKLEQLVKDVEGRDAPSPMRLEFFQAIQAINEEYIKTPIDNEKLSARKWLSFIPTLLQKFEPQQTLLRKSQEEIETLAKLEGELSWVGKKRWGEIGGQVDSFSRHENDLKALGERLESLPPTLREALRPFHQGLLEKMESLKSSVPTIQNAIEAIHPLSYFDSDSNKLPENPYWTYARSFCDGVNLDAQLTLCEETAQPLKSYLDGFAYNQGYHILRQMVVNLEPGDSPLQLTIASMPMSVNSGFRDQKNYAYNNDISVEKNFEAFCKTNPDLKHYLIVPD